MTREPSDVFDLNLRDLVETRVSHDFAGFYPAIWAKSSHPVLKLKVGRAQRVRRGRREKKRIPSATCRRSKKGERDY